ncbi:MAG: hypothetical protein KC731_04545 [Myxococcales bacterium]|nr:hypothetical protein [Myxococcales bacterium]
MSDMLTAAERAILDGARVEEDPSPERLARIHRAVLAEVAATATVTAVGAAAAADAATKTTAVGSLYGGKLMLTNILIVAGLASAGAVAGIASREPMAEVPATAPSSREAVPVVAEAPVVGARPEVVATAVPDDGPAVTRPGGVPSTATPTPGSDVQQEVALLQEAQRKLSGGDARGALRLLDEHARRFPRGALAQEAEAARVLALCQAGQRSAAREAARRFVERAPSSPMAERLRHACD